VDGTGSEMCPVGSFHDSTVAVLGTATQCCAVIFWLISPTFNHFIRSIKPQSVN
jgi:hypothetical protein